MLRSVKVWVRQRQIRGHRPGSGAYWVSLGWLGVLLVVGLLAPWLANDLPTRVDYDGDTLHPRANPGRWYALRDAQGQPRPEQSLGAVDWPREVGLDAHYAPIPYGPAGSNDALAPPGWAPAIPGLTEAEASRFQHLLGTDFDGRDVLACLIHGARQSLWVALLAAVLAWTTGIVIGTVSGFWGDEGWQVPRGYLWIMGLSLFLAWFYGFWVWPPAEEHSWFWLRLGLALSGVGGIHLLVMWLLRRRPRRAVPLDLLLNRIIEVLDSLPGLLLILALASLTQSREPGTLLLLLALVGWPRIARLIRAELLREKQQAYVEAARSLGLPERRILARHLLPNVLPQFLFAIAFSAGSFLLMESTLAFLGLVEGSASWGGLLRNLREDTGAWWVLWPPVLMIASTMMALYSVGQWWQARLDPRQGQAGPSQGQPKAGL